MLICIYLQKETTLTSLIFFHPFCMFWLNIILGLKTADGRFKERKQLDLLHGKTSTRKVFFVKLCTFYKFRDTFNLITNDTINRQTTFLA